jgi:pyruvate dehydrogenase E2 component (dihydrolipoamide acetyltransferase)
MAEIIKMPRLSDTMEEGVVATWLKNVGDQVKEGEILAEIETDKATMEFESFYDGTLLHIAIEEGVPATVDSLLCIIGDEGEDISKYINNSSLETTEKNEIENTTSNQLDLVDQINEQEKIDDSDNSKIENVEISITEKTNQIEGSIDYITMPRLSDTMEEGTISSWLKKVGDKVQEGEILAEIETDKATMEFESFYDGILSHIAVNEGETVKVDELIAIISENEIDVSKALETYGKESSNISVEESNDSVELNEVDKEINSTNTSSDLNERIKASPLAKKIAKEKNIDLSKVTGTGENGRIIKNDLSDLSPVEETTEQQIQTEENQSPKVVDVIKEETTIVQNSTMRKAIAKNLSKSKFTAPHYYLSVEFNMDNAIAFREQYNSIPDTKISFNDIVVKACAVALKNHPQVNSQWNDDKIILNNNVHIGVAVGIEDGLVVPVIKNADKESLHSINSKVRDYAVRAKSKKLRPDEIEGSTFTISNLGMFGITEFTSIINQPNSAILSVGAIVKKPVVVNDKIVVSNTMKLTLACDHRSVDGVTGSLFLQTLKGYIENPVTILV